MENPVRNFVESKRIAFFGASPNGKKFGNTIYKTLRKNGYTLFPVHPTADTIEGDKAYDNPGSLPGNIEAACICMKPNKAETVIENLASNGIKRIWFPDRWPIAFAMGKSIGALPQGAC